MHLSQSIYTAFIKALDGQSFQLHRRLEDDTASAHYTTLLDSFLKTCLSNFTSQDDTLVEAAFSGAMQVLKVYTHSFSEAFPVAPLEEIIMSAVQSSTSAHLMASAMTEFADLHIYGNRAIKRLMETAVITTEQAVRVMLRVEMSKTQDMPSFCYPPASKANWKKRAMAFSSCWMQVLKGLDGVQQEQLIKQVLLRLDEHVIPYLSKPALLIDFLSTLFTRGGIVGWLSLSSLFTLIRKHRLDYPHFFDHLLTMLTPQVMHSRYRRRFLSLTGTFMRSTHLTTEHRRAFLKRVVRLGLSAPPSAVHWIIPFCYNMLKEHSDQLHDMIHQKNSTNGDQLFELSALFSFHVGPIARQAAMLKERMVRPAFSLEKYLRQADRYTIPALIEAELSHKWSKAPPLNPTIPDKLFH